LAGLPAAVRTGLAGDAFGAAAALALLFPLARRGLRAMGARAAGQRLGSEGTGCMKRKPIVRSLETVSLDEATAYLEFASGDELSAAHALAWDRNRLDGSLAPPDDAEVHHALFLLSRARGLTPTSYDEMRVELRRRAAA
jgi:hypothetical protein